MGPMGSLYLGRGLPISFLGGSPCPPFQSVPFPPTPSMHPQPRSPTHSDLIICRQAVGEAGQAEAGTSAAHYICPENPPHSS